jgi:hypothetical protein
MDIMLEDDLNVANNIEHVQKQLIVDVYGKDVYTIGWDEHNKLSK